EDIDALVDSHLVGEDPGEWNFEGLTTALNAMGLSGEGTSPDELWEIGGREAVADHLRELADARLDAREAEIGEADWAQVERLVLVRTIDSLWVEHLTELDDMRRGIGLRGYAQQDPLNEFRREAFRLYEELRDLIRHGVASSIFRVTVQRQPAPDAGLSQALAAGAASLRTGSASGNGGTVPSPAHAVAAGAAATAGSAIVKGALPAGPSASNIRETLGDQPVAASPAATPGTTGAVGAGAASGGPRPGYTPTGQRIGRNDPCWCGSGTKYKKCHGR
ncbi:MAG: SEC-C metal-binding domain-containing protein, partial [Chloroflexota bacterium]|nr:SEC-C metal-binding domain-containing protein [Chloroflexota bacterium]